MKERVAVFIMAVLLIGVIASVGKEINREQQVWKDLSSTCRNSGGVLIRPEPGKGKDPTFCIRQSAIIFYTYGDAKITLDYKAGR